MVEPETTLAGGFDLTVITKALFAVCLVASCLVATALVWPRPLGAASSPEDLEPLRFLAGAWGSEDTVVEYWMPPLRGLMVGVNRETAGEGLPFFEYLRIEAREDGVFYVAAPRGGRTTDFELTESSAARAVFENPEHDFPQKIIYTRTDDRLEVEVGGERDGRTWSSFTLRWQLLH